VSCKKALEVLEQTNTEVDELIDARKEKITEEKAWELISNGKKIIVTKGKKILEFDPENCDNNEVLSIALGRSGTLRAPALKLGDEWIIGYNDELYAEKF